MTASLGRDVLRRKATVGRAAHEARAMTPAKALRLAIEKAADARLGLALSVTGGSRGPSDAAEVLDAMPEDGLLLLLQGPDGRIGALCLDFPLLSALVEMQTVGRVLSRDPDPRPTTRTDAAIVAPLVEDVLARFGQALASEDEGYWACGWRCGTRMPDRRVLGLALCGPEYQLFRVPVDIARGLRAGQMVLALPMAVRPAPPPDPALPDPGPDIAARLRHRLLDVPVPLDAVLCRLTMPLAQVRALAAGDVLVLPHDALVTTRLEAGQKRVMALAQLGQMNGRRALRLQLSGVAGGPEDHEAAGDALPALAPPQPQMAGITTGEAEAGFPAWSASPEASDNGSLPDPLAFDLPADLLGDLDPGSGMPL